MKRFCAVVMFCLFAVSPAAWAEGSDDQYIGIYSLIKQGDLFNERGQSGLAMAKYAEAQTALKKFQVNYPEWNSKVVKYRLSYLSGMLDELSGKTPAAKPPTYPLHSIATNPPVRTNPPVIPAVTNPPANTLVVPTPKTPNVSAPLPTDAADRIAALQDQVAHLEADKTMLESKLKEALAAQPAASDPRELAKVQERVKSLEKENDLLKFSLAQARTNTVAANLALLEQTRKELADANRKVNELTEANSTLLTERNALQARVKSQASPTPDTAAVALREENEILKKQLADLKTQASAPAPADELTRKLVEAQTQLAAMQSDKEILRIEKGALEERIRELSVRTNSTTTTVAAAPLMDSVTSGKIKQLELQRDELQKSLDAATKEIYGKKKGKETATRIDEMTRQLTGLRARIDTLESKQVPYTTEELSLLSKAETSPMTEKPIAQKPAKEPNGKTAALEGEGQRLWLANQLPEAEAKYQEALKIDGRNVDILLNLAAIQFDLRKGEESERNYQAALAIEPNNERAMFNLGFARLGLHKFDEALDFFSRAAEIDPKNSMIQNYIGITLSEKGLRGPAESAFRKSIQLDPNNAQAHANLSFVYIVQQPPLTELGRWHYQKALALGYKADPRLEKLLYPEGAISAR